MGWGMEGGVGRESGVWVDGGRESKTRLARAPPPAAGKARGSREVCSPSTTGACKLGASRIRGVFSWVTFF